MILEDYHVHTTFCDGRDTPETVVLSAISMGIKKLGFSAHSFIPGTGGYGLKPERVEEYRSEIYRLREKYAGSIELYCGVEQDIWSPMPTEGYDYVIGSVHHFKRGDKYPMVDYSPEDLKRVCNELFGGDFYALAEEYYAMVSEVVEMTGADIIGHFDLVTKFNEDGGLFDEKNERYVAAYRAAADKLVKYGVPFEINTGAISRGAKTLPYPSRDVMDYIISKGGCFIMSSDSHRADTLRCCFDKFEGIAGEHLNGKINFRTGEKA